MPKTGQAEFSKYLGPALKTESTPVDGLAKSMALYDRPFQM
jgi:hypothetical protein